MYTPLTQQIRSELTVLSKNSVENPFGAPPPPFQIVLLAFDNLLLSVLLGLNVCQCSAGRQRHSVKFCIPKSHAVLNSCHARLCHPCWRHPAIGFAAGPPHRHATWWLSSPTWHSTGCLRQVNSKSQRFDLILPGQINRCPV